MVIGPEAIGEAAARLGSPVGSKPVIEFE